MSAPSHIKEQSRSNNKAKYRCTVCGYIYDTEIGELDRGIKKGISFEDLSGDLTCPVCGAPKNEFEKIE